ncbi:hypothetical protein [Deinococcus cellulosilyticus]|uniref:hypothetical protein n=1 Tax=Deinococcus cellulosilyticus TaxID=401558 RepID=UPI0011BEB3B3|nr:hypothetical protein [Deinococcus cellulosilyticus]
MELLKICCLCGLQVAGKACKSCPLLRHFQFLSALQGSGALFFAVLQKFIPHSPGSAKAAGFIEDKLTINKFF